MDTIKDLLKSRGYDETSAKARPFSVPEDYFAGIEDSVRSQIKAKDERIHPWYEKFYNSIKAPAMLVITFGIIFGLGYGVIALTKTLNPDAFPTPEIGMMALIDEGYLSSDFIEDYYDEIDLAALTENYLEKAAETIRLNEGDLLLEEGLSQEDLIDYYLGY